MYCLNKTIQGNKAIMNLHAPNKITSSIQHRSRITRKKMSSVETVREFNKLLLETIYPGDKILLTCKKFEQLNQHMFSNKCGQSLQPVNRESVSFPSTYKSFQKMTTCNSRTQRKSQQTPKNQYHTDHFLS